MARPPCGGVDARPHEGSHDEGADADQGLRKEACPVLHLLLKTKSEYLGVLPPRTTSEATHVTPPRRRAPPEPTTSWPPHPRSGARLRYRDPERGSPTSRSSRRRPRCDAVGSDARQECGSLSRRRSSTRRCAARRRRSWMRDPPACAKLGPLWTTAVRSVEWPICSSAYGEIQPRGATDHARDGPGSGANATCRMRRCLPFSATRTTSME